MAATYTLPDDLVGASFSRLRTLRSGGDVMGLRDVEDMLRDRSYTDVESDIAPLATFTLGRLPPDLAVTG